MKTGTLYLWVMPGGSKRVSHYCLGLGVLQTKHIGHIDKERSWSDPVIEMKVFSLQNMKIQWIPVHFLKEVAEP